MGHEGNLASVTKRKKQLGDLATAQLFSLRVLIQMRGGLCSLHLGSNRSLRIVSFISTHDGTSWREPEYRRHQTCCATHEDKQVVRDEPF
jgi:hypothetical protein